MKDKKVLVVDDEKDFGLLMKGYLANKGFKVFVAYSIKEGMALLQKEQPDFIFLDNNLPDGLGWGKTEFILTHFPKAQLNLISAFEVPKTSSSSFRILYKPFIKDELNKMFG